MTSEYAKTSQIRKRLNKEYFLKFHFLTVQYTKKNETINSNLTKVIPNRKNTTLNKATQL